MPTSLHSESSRCLGKRASLILALSLLVVTAVDAMAQDNSSQKPAEATSSDPAASAEGNLIAIELNKLEAEGQNCRAYFVVGNKGGTEYQELKLDLVLFRPDGVIGRRFAVDLAPLKADKRSVKLFDIEGTACDQVGSFLINDVMECKAASGVVTDCLKNISVSTRTEVQLNK